MLPLTASRLWEQHQIDGMYTLATMDSFRTDLTEAARRHGLLAG